MSDRLPGSLPGTGLQAQEPSTERRPIRLDDLFEIKRVGDPQFSPDSGWVAYTVSESSLEKDCSETSIWMASTSDGAEIRMTRKGSSGSQPRWSPDGKYLSFRSGRPEREFQSGEQSSRSQVWLLNRRGGEAQQLTDIEQGVSGHEWSPDGKQLVLLIKDPKPGESEDGQETEKKPIPWVIDRLQFKRDRIGYLDRLRTHLYLFDVESRETRQLTFGDYADSEPVWSPDGKWITFVGNRSGRLGRETLLVVCPGESHGIRRPTFLKDRRLRALDWYDKYVKGWQLEATGN